MTGIALNALRQKKGKILSILLFFPLGLIDSEAMRGRGIIVLVKSIYLVKNIETKKLNLAKRDSAAIVLVFKAGAFRH